MKKFVLAVALTTPLPSVAAEVFRMPSPESFGYRILGKDTLHCSGSRCEMKVFATSTPGGCAIQYQYEFIEVAKGSEPTIVWTIESKDKKKYEFLPNGIEIHPDDLPDLDDTKDLADPGFHGGKHKFKWKSKNKRESPPKKWKYIFNIQKIESGVARQCAPVDPTIVNRGQ